LLVHFLYVLFQAKTSSESSSPALVSAARRRALTKDSTHRRKKQDVPQTGAPILKSDSNFPSLDSAAADAREKPDATSALYAGVLTGQSIGNGSSISTKGGGKVSGGFYRAGASSKPLQGKQRRNGRGRKVH